MSCRHRCRHEYYRPEDPNGTVGDGHTCGSVCNEPLFYLPYGRLPDWFVDPGPLDTEEIFCCQCRVDGSFDGGFPFVRQQGSAICQHRFGRIWQFERLLHPFLSGFIVDAPTAEEVSGLMIMGLFGGTVFPLLMGFASDALHSQTGALLVWQSECFTCFPFYKAEVVPAVRE